MIKKYVILIAVLLVILMFTSTSTASFLFSKQRIYERFNENSVFYKIFDRILNIASEEYNTVNNEDNNAIDPNEEAAVDTEPTIDVDGQEGTTLNDEPTVDENGETGTTLERIIDIITENNENLGTMLQSIVEHVYAPGTSESDTVAENIVDTLVVIGDPTGTSENNQAEVVVVTDNNQ